MKNFCIVCFSLFATVSANAQYTANVYWTEESGENSKSIIYYDATRPLLWADFKGQPGSAGPVAAVTTSGFGYKANMTSSHGKGQLNVGVYCYFSKGQSWVKPGKNTVYILNHEQHHFDVSFIAATMFMDRLKNTTLTLANYNAVLTKLYKECCDAMNKMQDDYDGQTKNGQLVDVQEKWNNFILGKLPYVTATR